MLVAFVSDNKTAGTSMLLSSPAWLACSVLVKLKSASISCFMSANNELNTSARSRKGDDAIGVSESFTVVARKRLNAKIAALFLNEVFPRRVRPTCPHVNYDSHKYGTAAAVVLGRSEPLNHRRRQRPDSAVL